MTTAIERLRAKIAEVEQEVRRQYHEAQAAEAAIARVESIHHLSVEGGFCVGCWEAAGEDGAPSWPCPTIIAIRGEW